MIVYIHGFNSAGEGDKHFKLKKFYPNIDIYSPTYDSSDFNSIDKLMDNIEIDENLLIIGNSLGGYIAMYLAKKYEAKCIILNPTTDPISELTQFIGENVNFITNKKYLLTQKNIDILKKYKIDIDSTNITIYVNEDDDIINYKNTISFFENKRKVYIFKTGGHRFENMENIKNDILFIYNQI